MKRHGVEHLHVEGKAGKPLAVRFWPKVDKRGPDECWPWLAFKDPKGYGRIARPGDSVPMVASRASWIVNVGPIPEGMNVLHRCDSPPCVNPAHLFLGTLIDNNLDMRRKGRDSAPPIVSKLTEDNVRDIRNRHKGRYGDTRALADEYGMSKSAITAIVNGHTWKHVK